MSNKNNTTLKDQDPNNDPNNDPNKVPNKDQASVQHEAITTAPSTTSDRRCTNVEGCSFPGTEGERLRVR